MFQRHAVLNLLFLLYNHYDIKYPTADYKDRRFLCVVDEL